VNEYVLNALKGFARAMSLGVSRYIGSVMQDMLSLLQIWFKYSEYPGVGTMLKEYLRDIPLDCWLGVLPQLIARIHHEGDIGRSLLHDLLSRLGTLHAQALMFPLSVALQSPREDRQLAAQSLLMNLRQHSAPLINQSVLVSQELIRIAILWDEEWYATLEDSSRLYFGEGNIQKMLDLLLPLHEKLLDGPKTSHEGGFMQSYGTELKDAHQCLVGYVAHMERCQMNIPTAGARPSARSGGQARSPEEVYLVRAWDLYIPIFKRITPTLKQIVSHTMSHVSPQLVEAHDLDLAIPGTYTLTGEAVRIKGFSKQFGVILSKQRPRKIRLFGLDGLEYVFLLKGHEDLRQDERAMQLFGLVNALLEHDHRTVDHDLSIQRYAVVPLSPNAGLVGWVPKCDTLHDLIRTYRQSKNIMLDVEQMLMQQLCPFNIFEHLTPLQKLEVFEHALNNTSGQDLHKILWYQSTSSESWIIRRDTYTKSLAVMSVVGYVLGLGDRHPSNLMLQRSTCKILHIDFGDCFEVAMHRDKFPEKIPFRLTRMLVLAMEVSVVVSFFCVGHLCHICVCFMN
jgi:serine/threonine-protein kinase mTOR